MGEVDNLAGSSTNTLGKYQIIREVARSNDIVYEAIDPTINRRVALKELSLPPNLQGAQRRERIERFWREGKAAGRLSHPNIVTIFEVGTEGDRHYIAMEFLEGQTLRDVLQVGGPLPIRDVLNYGLQLCDALAYAHRNGVVHRDIKPENVQILPGGHVKLTDFGIARLMGESSITQNGQVFGTPSYMSPEQVAGKAIDARSDIFSLGVVLYEMVAGKKPFVGDSLVTITYNIMNMEAPPPPGAPPYLAGIIRKAMAKDPNMRYSSVDEIINDLKEEKCADGYTVDLGGPTNIPSPFGGAQSGQTYYPQPQQVQQPHGPLTPYGTPMPSPNAGAPSTSASDPFSQGAPVLAPMPPPEPPQPLLSAETRNFLGILFLLVGFLGMLITVFYLGNIAYHNYRTAVTSETAAKYYAQGNKLYERGNIDAAVDQWKLAIQSSPGSKVAKTAREAIFNVLIVQARKYYDERNVGALQTEARDMIDADSTRPEGHYYMAMAHYLSGDMDDAKKEYQSAADCGGNDEYAQSARQYLSSIYLNEGDRLASGGQKDAAIASYEKARDVGDADTMATAQQKIDSLKNAQ